MLKLSERQKRHSIDILRLSGSKPGYPWVIIRTQKAFDEGLLRNLMLDAHGGDSHKFEYCEMALDDLVRSFEPNHSHRSKKLRNRASAEQTGEAQGACINVSVLGVRTCTGPASHRTEHTARLLLGEQAL